MSSWTLFCADDITHTKEETVDRGPKALLKYWPLITVLCSVIATATAIQIRVNYLVTSVEGLQKSNDDLKESSTKELIERAGLRKDIEILQQQIRELKERLESKKIVNRIVETEPVAGERYRIKY